MKTANSFFECLPMEVTDTQDSPPNSFGSFFKNLKWKTNRAEKETATEN
jgi:hypothetical protein